MQNVHSNSAGEFLPARIGNAPITMSSREIADLCEKRHDHVLRDIERMLLDINAPNFGAVDFEAQYQDAKGEWRKEYRLPKDLTITLITGYRADLRYRVVKKLEEMESGTIPQTLPQALRLAADLAEQNSQLTIERDTAIATKAEIGTRREATAMNTASQAVKKASRLELELDRSRSYATIKRMELLYHGQKFSWRLLKSTSTEIGIPTIEVFDANYGTVKGYHADVWREAYALEIPASEEGTV